ncbi:hypothetical protein CSUI_006241 [Cystoisospora suis]|uniref:Uncharacterized protein n=1 Tax=Cystoisospora suis TaxID=483139 RepID=A0A2C6KV21_9APIC|nr:hypothetical protein CSUI_006241 [Cystoisospora suis]
MGNFSLGEFEEDWEGLVISSARAEAHAADLLAFSVDISVKSLHTKEREGEEELKEKEEVDEGWWKSVDEEEGVGKVLGVGEEEEEERRC